ncbi:fumarate hydratase [Methanohalophilus mahii]|uniref:Fumarase alpha subunit n=1 Tax=Methanohalophilus mahii (strain ATCC 35705 / DSM 5219 / SLP) TaxID=547558 RepID=D5E6J6_METMS|nr:fumarate hydratase [Methanohalophilus mahii]ADE36784.1 fumarase alpha subunit [Methanohalophilus mahii DSM 5219]
MESGIKHEDIVQATVSAIQKAETVLTEDVVASLEKAEQEESSEVAQSHLKAILKNIGIAHRHSVPICQDTGIIILFVEIGRKISLLPDIEQALIEGVRKATVEVPLRPNVVHPLTRENSGDNTGNGLPDIKYSFNDSDKIRITAVPKGAGSENMSILKMLNPSEVDSIDQLVLETVMNAGGKPCPPIILGIGLGGSFDKAALLAKTALLGRVDNMDQQELNMLEKVNRLGVGPMGTGGDTTALAVHINKAYCHTASLPVAINIQCWANRHATAVIGGDGQWNII